MSVVTFIVTGEDMVVVPCGEDAVTVGKTVSTSNVCVLSATMVFVARSCAADICTVIELAVALGIMYVKQNVVESESVQSFTLCAELLTAIVGVLLMFSLNVTVTVRGETVAVLKVRPSESTASTVGAVASTFATFAEAYG